MTLEELIVRLRNEEDNCDAEKKNGKNPIDSKANVVEQVHKPHNNKRKYVEDGTKQSDNNDNKKFKGKCYNYGKTGHRASDYRRPKKDHGSTSKKTANQANVTEVDSISKGVNDISPAMVSEANLVRNPKEWWIDTWATRHTCVDRKMFTSYSEATN
ncbi:uncharacterized protein LOC114298875 [Camellia sinensis]|uniref:uncharacterized protein LOC114298875 n=1 Tax=Camellia sinensis TaxID=4442 RepID=UPI001036D5DD|nr:uncharacterized protein LOC114298875 [Camellia sinensis]